MSSLGFLARWFGRRTREARLGEVFSLPARARVHVGALWLQLDGDGAHVIVEGGFDPHRPSLGELPVIVSGGDPMYEVRLRDAGPPARLEVNSWTGLRIAAPVTTVDWPVEELPPGSGRACPTVAITGVWSLDASQVKDRPPPLYGVHEGLLLVTRHPDGRTSAATLRVLERSAFTAKTGVHPSWAEPRPAPEKAIPADLRGAFTADLGPSLPRPTTEEELVVFAVFGSVQSNELRLRIRP